MHFLSFLFLTLFLWHQGSLANQVCVENDDEIELYRQLFLRLNTIVKSNIELKGDILDLKEEIKKLKESRGLIEAPSVPKNDVIIPVCSSSEKSAISKDFDNVYCFDNNWMIVQRRVDGSENFDRTWNEYKNGFGNPSGEFFIGLEKLYAMTILKPHELLIVLQDFDKDIRYAKYDNFQLGSEGEQYRLKQLGSYTGTAGDSLAYHKDGKFSTKDRDNDDHPTISCSRKFGGGWWYRSCHESNLNGQYVHTDHDRSYASGIHWKSFRRHWYSLKFSQIMIRPKS